MSAQGNQLHDAGSLFYTQHLSTQGTKCFCCSHKRFNNIKAELSHSFTASLSVHQPRRQLISKRRPEVVEGDGGEKLTQRFFFVCL